MVIERIGKLLPFSCEQIFDLAADVEHYPEFLKWWISARVTRAESNKLFVDQVLGFGPIHMQFASEAVLRRPEAIVVTSADTRFREFRLAFYIARDTPACCTLRIQAQLEPRSMFLRQIVNEVLGSSIDDIIAAFELRAHQLYTGRFAVHGLPQ